VHNAINYKISRTGDGFDPHAYRVMVYPKMEIYVLFDETRFTKERLLHALTFVGTSGYGKKATVGKGRFEVKAMESVDLPSEGVSFMALSPVVLQESDAKDLYYDTFVRFGKHGAQFAQPKAFKKPVLMADTAAVMRFDEKKRLPFTGKGIGGVSEIHKNAVHQGYAITVAIGVDDATL
jgi:CRISPR-associated protein Csm4